MPAEHTSVTNKSNMNFNLMYITTLTLAPHFQFLKNDISVVAVAKKSCTY